MFWGFGFQFLFGILVLHRSSDYEAVKLLSQEISKLLFYSFVGAGATFGDPWFLLHPLFMLVGVEFGVTSFEIIYCLINPFL